MKNKLTYITLSAIILIFAFCFSLNANKESLNISRADSANNIITLTNTSYEKETAEGLVLVYFWAPWCGPCRKMSPAINEIAKENKEIVKIGKVNVENYKKLTIEKGIESVPTIIVYKNGKEIERYLGRINKDGLQSIVNSNKAGR